MTNFEAILKITTVESMAAFIEEILGCGVNQGAYAQRLYDQGKKEECYEEMLKNYFNEEWLNSPAEQGMIDYVNNDWREENETDSN